MLVAQQEVVFEGSKSLCLATNNKAYFGNVTIVIPDDWVKEGENVDGMTWPRNFQADVVVNEEHPVFGAKPFTLQYGSCGMGGLPIQIPFVFFNKTEINKSKRGINVNFKKEDNNFLMGCV